MNQTQPNQLKPLKYRRKKSKAKRNSPAQDKPKKSVVAPTNPLHQYVKADMQKSLLLAGIIVGIEVLLFIFIGKGYL